jgi:rod shape-determining protein MreC
VVSLVAASLAIITIDYRGGDQGPLAEAGTVVNSALAPLQRAVSSVVQPVSEFFTDVANLPGLADRNRALQRQVDELRTQAQQNQELQDELTTLSNLLGLQGAWSDLRPVAAQVIAKSSVSNFQWTITIDHGSEHGIAVDMPVVAGDASEARLVGRVTDVTPNSAMVQLLIDRDFAVAGVLSTSNEAGMVEGRGEEDLRMDLIDEDTRVSETEPESVFTLGYAVEGQAGLYPAKLLIGTVSRAFSGPDSVETFVTVRPAVDFSTLRYVLVLARPQQETP